MSDDHKTHGDKEKRSCEDECDCHLKPYLKFVAENYKRKHPELYDLDESIFAPTFLKAAKAADKESALALLENPHPGIYSFECFTEEFCNKMVDEIKHFEIWSVKNHQSVQRPNSMNRYGVILDHIGFYDFCQDLMTTYLEKLGSLLYAENSGANNLDSHHAFIVEYEMERDLKLGFHVDNAELTLNVCLGEEFADGDLFFRGVRCEKHCQLPPLPDDIFDFAHRKGVALLHLGRHRHGAKPITVGHRLNMIIWCRSSKFRSSYFKTLHDCQPWCTFKV